MLKREMFLTLVLAWVIAVNGSQARAELGFHLKVTDESGKKIDKFEVLYHTYHGQAPWQKGYEGEIELGTMYRSIVGGEEVACHQLIVRAEGYAPEILRFENPKGTIEKEIVLEKGKRELILTTADGRAIPEGLEPMVVFSEFEDLALRSYQYLSRGLPKGDFDMSSVVKVEDGKYIFNISNDSPEFFVFIDYPGYLRAFRSGPYSVKDLKSNQLKIELPRPATIEVGFEPPKDWVGELPFKKCGMDICWNKPSTNSGYPAVIIQAEEPHLKMEREYFAPGDYWISFHTVPTENPENKQGDINIGAYRDMEEFSLAEGQNKSFVFEYTPYDPNSYKGDCNATFAVRWADKRLAAGETYSLYYEDIHYDSVLINRGTLNNKGKINLTGVNSKKDENYYTLLIREGELGRFFFQLDCEQKTKNIEFSLGPIAGDKILDITLQDVSSDREVKLSELRGKVIFLEFWATGCGPCQEPMASLCKLHNSKKTEWEGKAALLAVSLDDNKETLVNHVQNRGWAEVRHLWCHEGERGFKSKAAVTYGISGVPTALLIDKNGNIVWRGHPGSVDIEAKIDELLKTGK